MGSQPEIAVDGLVAYELKRRYVDDLMASLVPSIVADVGSGTEQLDAAFERLVEESTAPFVELVRSPELVGHIPPVLWLDRDLHRSLTLFAFNHGFDLAGLEVVDDPTDALYAPIALGDDGEVQLRGARRSRSAELVAHRRRSLGTTSIEVHHWSPKVTKNKPSDDSNLVVRLIELLALRCNAPDAECSIITSMPPEEVTFGARKAKKGDLSISDVNLNPQVILRATPSSLPAMTAREQLRILVGLYRRGLEEPLPIFRKTSAALLLGADAEEAWEGGYFGRGDATELANQLLFPLSFHELVASTEVVALAEVLRAVASGVDVACLSRTDRGAAPTLAARLSGESTKRSDRHVVFAPLVGGDKISEDVG